MSTTGGRLPYPGLRSFTREETDLFFGREGCVDDMVDRLAASRFLAVLGASGSGKSSLVKTGLLDALEIGLLHQAGSRWLIAEFRPGEHPIESMAEALTRAAAADPSAVPDEEEVKLLRTFLARGPRSVVEWCEANLPEGTNLLLLVDQFEELFRYGAYSEREEAEAFVAKLLESAKAPLSEARIYVTITMRSEYLGAAALIDGLAEAINRGLYLTPRMSRDEVRDAIVGPAAVCGFEIEPALVNRLLNDLTSFAPWDGDSGHQLERLVRRADQLPLMQHVLNRLWSIAAEEGADGPVVLKLADYEELGGLRGALAAHGREILEELLPEHRALAPIVFRALTAGSSLAEAVRRPTEFGELVALAGGDEIAVREIIEAFRAPGRNFLVPSRPTPLRPTTLIDISHESLIRQWDEFAAWLQQEVTAADTWRRLVDLAERYRRGEGNLLSDLALASNASWWDREQPTAAWAKRYGGHFEQTAKYLADSRSAEAASEAAKAQEQRQKSRNRLMTAAVIIILCIITPLTGFAGYSAWRANQEAERANAAAAAADVERQNAEQERQDAIKAREEADRQRQAAEAERQRADAESARARAARVEALAQADAARSAEEEARQQALAARAAEEEAKQQALEATAARDREAQARQQVVALERQRTEEAFRRSILEQLADRISALQQAGSWEIASNLLGALWQKVSGLAVDSQGSWLIDPIVKAFARQSMAEYQIVPDFLKYAGLDGWTGTSGRFRVYALDRKAADGSTISGNKVIALFDAMTGAVLGSFELPSGANLGSDVDLVTPDGSRVAIVTSDPTPDDSNDDRRIALWAGGQSAPTVIPMPSLGTGAVKVDQIAPVNTDARFALSLTLESKPAELIVVDPAKDAITFSIAAEDIAKALGITAINDVTLLGLVGDQLVVLVDNTDGSVLSIDVTSGAVRNVETGGGVSSAALTPDGALLVALSCPDNCPVQHLTALDFRFGTPLWVERVPTGLTLTKTAIHDAVVAGTPAYSVLVQNAGTGIIFQIPKDTTKSVVRLDAASNARMDATAFDGSGGYRVVESVSGSTTSSGLEPAGALASYRIPASRQKLKLYVAPNSVAIYQRDDVFRIAGVTYQGDLLVYRMRPDGEFEEDVAFQPMKIAESNCLAAVSFGGDGRSLLMRHIDGSLLFVAAVGNGANIGWHQVDGSGAGKELKPETSCDAPAADAVPEKIVPADGSSTAFALLDKDQSVSWVNVVDSAAQRDAPSLSAPARAFAPLDRISTGATWITADPARNRVAIVTAGGVEIVTHAMAAPAPETADARSASAPAEAGPGYGPRGGEAAASAQEQPRQQRLLRWSEPKAAVFNPGGGLVVAYGGGQISSFQEAPNGTWAVKFDKLVFRTSSGGAAKGLYASKGGISVSDDRGMMMTLDPETGALSGFARLPANPSALALKGDGKALSLEWDTDSVATFDFRQLTSTSGVADPARLVSMRSLLDPAYDTSLDSLTIAPESEQASQPATEAVAVDCGKVAAAQISLLESRLLGEAATPSAAPDAAQCEETAANGSLSAVEALAERGQNASVRELVEDGAFSRVLQAAAVGDRTATRILGAVLARIAIARGDLDEATIAKDALRFGTSLPSALMKTIAAGGPIDPSLLEAARQRAGADPVLHQLIAHADERHIDDIGSLTEALFEYSIAERLYRASGRNDQAEFSAHRRAELARALPDDRVLAVLKTLEGWQPPAAEAASSVTLPDMPADSSSRRSFDMENEDQLAANLPDLPLLGALRVELERARIFDLQSSDPKTATKLMIDLGRRTGAAGSWSPDLVREYLDLADGIGVATDPADVFRLAAEAMRLVNAGFKTPIHGNADAADLFDRAATTIAATAPAAPHELVSTAMADVDLGLLQDRIRHSPRYRRRRRCQSHRGAARRGREDGRRPCRRERRSRPLELAARRIALLGRCARQRQRRDRRDRSPEEERRPDAAVR